MTNLIGVEIRLKIDNTVKTFAGVNLSVPSWAAKTAKITIDEKMGSIFIRTST